ncbi:hypothetical protein L0128_00605 [candidate division KSB1 bacterium]|nr:hypothetical protein [candidate division KSB1 bacterium]
MNRKNIQVECSIFVLAVLLFCSPSTAQNSFHFDTMMSINFSHPIASPINETAKGQTYSVQYVPGYDWAGIFSFQRNRITVGIGLGYKNINFNHVRNFVEPEFPYGWSYAKSLTIARLHYLYMPVQTSIMLNSSKELYVSLNAEFCKLCNDVYYNITILKNGSQSENRYELHEFYKPNSVFLYLGTGMRIKSNTKMAFELGFVPKCIDRNREGIGFASYFNFSKKIVACRITFIYELFSFTF